MQCTHNIQTSKKQAGVLKYIKQCMVRVILILLNYKDYFLRNIKYSRIRTENEGSS